MRPSATMRLGPVVPLVLACGLLASACSGADAGAGTSAASSSGPGAPVTTAGGPRPTPSETPTPTHTSWGPSLDELDRAGEVVAEMSVPQRAGQVIVATYGGLEPPVELVS